MQMPDVLKHFVEFQRLLNDRYPLPPKTLFLKQKLVLIK
jgi:hypothetical protein